MARIKITAWGSKEYLDDYGGFHREDGPAVIYPNGRMYWYILGIYTRTKYINGGFEFRDAERHVRYTYPNGSRFTYNESGWSIWPKL